MPHGEPDRARHERQVGETTIRDFYYDAEDRLIEMTVWKRSDAPAAGDGADRDDAAAAAGSPRWLSTVNYAYYDRDALVPMAYKPVVLADAPDRPCPACGGRGQVPLLITQSACPACAGTGRAAL